MGLTRAFESCVEQVCVEPDLCYYSVGNNTVGCIPPCSYDCTGHTCNENVCDCEGEAGGNFCEYALCYDYCYPEGTTTCTGSTGCVCEEGFALPNCGVAEDSDLLTLYYYLKKFFWDESTDPPVPAWCNNTVTAKEDPSNKVTITCDGDERIIELDFEKGSYAFPDSFATMTELKIISFKESKLSFIDENIETLPDGILEIHMIDIFTPSNGFTNLTGEWKNVGATLKVFEMTLNLNFHLDTQPIISPGFGKDLPEIETLILKKAQFKGTIPGHIFHLPSLQTIDLSSNAFTAISEPTGTLSTAGLVSVDLSGNSISMPFATFLGYLPEEGTENLDVENNLFSGPIVIPETFGLFLTFKAGTNRLNGTLPDNFMHADATELRLRPERNNFTCPIADYSTWADTTDFSSEFTNCTDSSLCLHGSTFTTNGNYPCVCTSGWYGPYCAFENEQQLDLYTVLSSWFSPEVSMCNQKQNECNSQKLLTQIDVGNFADGIDISFLTHTTSILGAALSNVNVNNLPASVTSINVTTLGQLRSGKTNLFTSLRTTLPNLKNLTVTNSAGSVTNLNLHIFPKLERLYYKQNSARNFKLARIFLTHPTLKSLVIDTAAINAFDGSSELTNNVLEEMEIVQSSVSTTVYAPFNIFCDQIMPSMPNLKTLEIPGLFTKQPGGFMPTSCQNFLPSTTLDLSDCAIGGTIPTYLNSLGLSTLNLETNNFAYPIANYSTWATTTDYLDFSDEIKTACQSAECEEGEVCTLAAECAPLSAYAGPQCKNGGNAVGTYGNYSCNCTEGFFGPICAFTTEEQVPFYEWATRAQFFISQGSDICATSTLDCLEGQITATVVSSMYGDLFTPEDFDTSATSIIAVVNSYVTNAEDFMLSDFDSLSILSFQQVATPEEWFPTISNVSKSDALELSISSYTSRIFTPLVGFIPKFNLSCSLMKELNTLTLAVDYFTMQDCSDDEGVQTLETVTLQAVTNVTTDRFMASMFGDLKSASIQPLFPGPITASRVTETVIYKDEDLLKVAFGNILQSSFHEDTQYGSITIEIPNVLCPVFDYSAISNTSNYDYYNYAAYDSKCVFCRAIEECAAGHTCNNTIPACVPNTDFCDFPQCVNGGTCVSANNSCLCQGAYSGTYCQIGPICNCQNGGTCLDSGNCHCSIFFTGNKCQTPVVNPCGCENGGTCLENGTCACPPGFSGNKCQNRDNCDCENGGTCTENGICVCPPGFTGSKCQNENALSGGATAGIVVGCVVGVAVIGIIGAAASGAFSGGTGASAASSYIPMR